MSKPSKPRTPKPVPKEEIEVKVDDDESVNAVDPSLTDETKAKRRKRTIEEHITRYDTLFELLNTEIDRKSRMMEKGVKTLRTVRKVLEEMRKDVPHIAKSKAARQFASNRKESSSGIMIQYPISKELADFLQLPHDTSLSRVDATRAICVYANIKENEKRETMLRWKYLNPGGKRNLQVPYDKRAIVPDKKLTKLLGYDEYKRKVANGEIMQKVKNKETGMITSVEVSNDALYYTTIQRLVGIHLLTDDADASAGDVDDADTDE